MKRGYLAVAGVAALLLLGLAATLASAHEGREVGPYLIEFGWRVEPAYAGQANGPEIFISVHDTGEAVEGAEETLRLEVMFGSQTKLLSVQAAPQEPGHYFADLIPTRPGDYSFHMTGSIGDTPVDEVFSSVDGEFSSVEPASDVMFPDSELSMVDLQAQIQDLQAQVEELQAQIAALQSGAGQ